MLIYLEVMHNKLVSRNNIFRTVLDVEPFFSLVKSILTTSHESHHVTY